MFWRKKQEPIKEENEDTLFNRLCLLILEKRDLRGIDWEGMIDICETAEEMEYIIKNYKSIRPQLEKKPEKEEGRLM